MLALADTQRAIATVAIFLATFFVTISIGRLLKRRAGVPFGIFFQLFALTLSCYAAASVYGLDLSWRHHLGAALILLSTTVVVALINRYIWNAYFERRGIAVPKLLRDLVAALIFLITLMIVLSVGYHAETQLKGLLAGSGVLAIILGFAAQNLLSGIIAGLSLQIQRPYKVGDWLKIGGTYGEVMEIRWGSTRLRTNDSITLHIPNNEMVKQTIVNLSYPTRAHVMRLSIGAEYGAAPNRVKEALVRAAIQAPGVEKHPPPQAYVSEYGESAIIYEIKFTMSTHSGYSETRDAIYTNAWYIFRRRKITIPFPIRTGSTAVGGTGTSPATAGAPGVIAGAGTAGRVTSGGSSESVMRPLLDRMTARSRQFFNCRTFPGQWYKRNAVNASSVSSGGCVPAICLSR